MPRPNPYRKHPADRRRRRNMRIGEETKNAGDGALLSRKSAIGTMAPAATRSRAVLRSLARSGPRSARARGPRWLRVATSQPKSAPALCSGRRLHSESASTAANRERSRCREEQRGQAVRHGVGGVVPERRAEDRQSSRRVVPRLASAHRFREGVRPRPKGPRGWGRPRCAGRENRARA
jgi:hypothetical protein